MIMPSLVGGRKIRAPVIADLSVALSDARLTIRPRAADLGSARACKSLMK
jgi:hypothetical protein